jgi:hypothetical protein
VRSNPDEDAFWIGGKAAIEVNWMGPLDSSLLG